MGGITNTRARTALLVALAAAMLIPVLEIAVAAVAAVAVAAFITSLMWTRGQKLPASLAALQIGAGLFTAGIVVRVIEAAVTGAAVYPGPADLLTIPAYLITIWGVGRAAMSRHALAKGADVIDACVVAATAITVSFSLRASFLFSDTIGRLEQVNALVYTVTELVFLAVVVLLIFGPGARTPGTKLLAFTGLYAALFDNLWDALYAFNQPALVDQLLRTIALPIVTYALATSYPGYTDFARPGVRRQHHRWGIYGVSMTVLVVLVARNPATIELVGLATVGVLASLRLGVANTVATRLQDLNAVQRQVAWALADADNTEAALDAGVAACADLLPSRTSIEIESTVLSIRRSRGNLGAMTVDLNSHDQEIRITVDQILRPHLWTALVSIADTLTLAVQAVESRTARITARTEADWRALSGKQNELVFIVDTEGTIVTKATPNASAIIGRDPVGLDLADLLGQDLEGVLDGRETELLFCDADERWLVVTAQPAESGSHVVTVKDATARVREAHVDEVTGLNNMRHFARGGVLENATLIVYRVEDIDRVNDAHQKEGADRLLRAVAERTEGSVRKGIDRVWRGDGPTFVAVCSGARHSHDYIADRRDQIAAPLIINGTRVVFKLSAVVVPINGLISVEAALRQADLTAAAPNAGPGDGIRTFTPELEEQAHRRFQIEAALATISDPGQSGFRVHYQPIIDAQDGTIDRVEALLRWTNAELGRVSPVEFIPLAEKAGQVAILDQFVLSTACRDLATFPPHLNMQVNLSPVGLTAKRLYDMADWISENYPTPPRLTIEIIESAIGDFFTPLVPALEKLRTIGVGLSVDDYGVGESNIARLTRLPLTQVKLAGLFSTEIHPDTINRVVGTIHSMGYKCVVESVETAAQSDMMVAAGADYLQGWLISKDLPAPDLLAFIDSYNLARSESPSDELHLPE